MLRPMRTKFPAEDLYPLVKPTQHLLALSFPEGFVETFMEVMAELRVGALRLSEEIDSLAHRLTLLEQAFRL